MIRELAFAKVNLVLHVGRPRPDGMHSLASLFASIELADELHFEPAEGTDAVICHGVEGDNLVAGALAAFRERVPGLPPLRVAVEKRIPVAAGLGGGSADAAAALRAANRLTGRPLGTAELRELGARLGSDVPSQVEPRHGLVTGTGQAVEPVDLPPFVLVLVPFSEGLLTKDVYAEFDRLGGGRERLDPDRLRRLAGAPLEELAAGVENDLEPAALSLRPELEGTLSALRDEEALAAAISGSGPTALGLFGSLAQAQAAAERVEGALVARPTP